MKARTIGAGRFRRLLVAATAVALLTVCVTGAATAKPGSADATKRALRLGLLSSSIAAGFNDPAKIQSTFGTPLAIAYAPLIHDNPDGTFSPGLATSWRYLNGHKKFELTLRKNARFSDGTPVTAAAVVGWLKYYANSKNFASSLLGPKPKFKATGKYTVLITMTVPNPVMPLLLSEENANWGFVASPKAVANPKLFANASYGAGQYKLDYSKTTPGDHYTFVPNPYYWDKSKIRFSQIYVKAIASPASMLQALQAGQLDVAWSTDASTAPAAAKAGLQVVSAPFAVNFAQLNPNASKPLADVRVRQAMNYALDRKAIAQAMYGDYGKGSSEFTITPDADPGLQNYYDYNPTKAKQLLAAAGYPNGFEFGIDAGVSSKFGEIVAHYLDAVGIKTKVITWPTGAAWVDAIFTFKEDAWIIAADVGVPTPIEYNSFIAPGNSFAGGEPKDPEVHRLYYKGLNSKDPAPAWKEMWARIVKQAWFLPLASTSNVMLASKDVGGIAMSAKNPYSYPTEWFFK
jgi:peptide/nickel transport system substrate-binding protein